MTKEQTYELIGRLALALYGQKLRISLASLNAILRDQKAGYESMRGLAAGVSASYDLWERRGDPITAEAIAHTYTDRNGELAWKKYRKPASESAEGTG